MKLILPLAAALLAFAPMPAVAATHPAKPHAAKAAGGLTAGQKAQIDKTVSDALSKSQAPSASIAVVVDGKIAYVRAYGDAQLIPERLASPTMRYAIGSVSKQFTAAAVLMLVEDDRLSLDEPISRWYPKVTSANRITLRQLLSHTSGIPDFWPQDYVMTPMTRNADPDTVIAEWGAKPLDFPPGLQYEYSNTGYMIAGRIVEKVSGMSLEAFLRKRIWKPLGMTSVVNYDAGGLKPGKDPVAYDRAALGPSRPALHEGSGWGVGAFQWAMTAQDLAKWDVSLINKKLMEISSYDEFFAPQRLTDGKMSNYALGLQVRAATSVGRYPPPGSDKAPFVLRVPAVLTHSGEVSGFVSANTVYPNEKAAVVVLTNAESESPAGGIAANIGGIIDPPIIDNHAQLPTPSLNDGPGGPPHTPLDDQVAAVLAGLQKGEVDRSVMTQNLSDYFSPQVVKDFADSLGPLGPAIRVTGAAANTRGGMTYRSYRAVFMDRTVSISIYVWPDGKLEQFLVSPA